ncbi:SNF1-interacting protein [Amphichorda felina]
MAEATTAPPPNAVKSSHRAIAVGLYEAALDSPTFRATAAHFADQIDAIERWLNGYVNSTSKLLHDILALEETINSYLSKTMPSATDGVIDNDYTFLALKRVGDGSREFWMQLLSTMKRTDNTVVEPIRAFLVGDMRNFKEIRKVLEQSQRTYDSTLARYVAQSKTKEPSHLREDAFSVYETRKAYLQASMDYCQLAPQVRFTMDKLLVKVSGELWKELKRSRDATANATRWEHEMERVRGWAREMEASEGVFRRELQIARRDLGDNALTGCKPSRELEDYNTSTVAFLGSRGPMNMRPRNEKAVISEKQGWLYLRTLSGKPARHNWVRRWYYCRDRVFGWLIPGPQGVLQGDEIGVLLCNAKPAPGEDRRFCFEVKTKSQTLMLQAETQNDLTEWLEVFEVIKKKAFEATMDRSSSASGNTDPAFSISPPSIPEFSARTLDTQLGLTMDEGSVPAERTGALPVPSQDGHLASRTSFDPNGSISRRTISALGRDLAREEGESGREHAARIIQKLDLHRKATFGAGAEAALASSSGSAGGLANLAAASHILLPNSPAGSKYGNTLLPSVDSHPGTLAPLTLAMPPAVTSLSRTAVLTAAQRDATSGNWKIPASVLANYWGSSSWGAIHDPPPDPILPRLDEDDPVGVVVTPADQNTPLAESLQQKQAHDMLPSNYPPELRAQHAQFRLLFPSAPVEEKLVLVFRAAWSSTPSAPDSNGPALTGDGRIFVTPDHMYFYGQQMGLVTAYTLSLDMISEVTAAPGKENDYIFFHLGQNANDTGYSKITIKVFLDNLRILHTRLNLLIDDLQAEVPMETGAIVAALINVEKDEFERHSPTAESWEEVSENTPHDDGTPAGRSVRGRPFHESIPQLPMSGSRVSFPPKLHLPSHPVDFEPDDMHEMAAERHFEISAKSCFHVLFGDKSFVFPKLYFEHRAQQIAQGPWVVVDDRGRMRREFQFKVNHTDMLGRNKTMDITDYQTIDMHSEHVTYVVTHVKTAWHLPHFQNFKLVAKVVITFVAKSKCRLAIYTRVDWSKAPALSKNLIERQALHDAASNAEELAELATDQVRKLGAWSRTHRAIQVYGQVGHQTQVVIFSPAATEGSRKQTVKPRTLTALIWETVRSFGESAISSLIMWGFAGLRKLFKVLTAQRLLLALLGISALANLVLTSNETATWWKERRAAEFMRHLGVGPNTMMSKAIYMQDLPEATGSSKELSFPQNSTCFASFKEVLDVTDMDAPWEDAGFSFSSPTTRSTARRLRRTRQRLGTYRHDLVVAMRVVNSVEREMLQSEWENWLVNEVSLCEDLATVLQSADKGGNAEGEATMQKVLRSMGTGKREALMEWQKKHCGSCKADHEAVMTERKLTGF